MLPRDVFYKRRDEHCAKCEFWSGVCLKGHALSSPQGCPLKKFEPVSGASYAVDVQVDPHVPAVQAVDCCGKDKELTPMSWSEAADHLRKSLGTWVADGCPIVTDTVYTERVSKCQDGCPHYKWFQCRQCKCVVLSKAKLPHETCPAGRWSI